VISALPQGHRVAVIGAAGAIGSAICRAYAAAGATVTSLDLDGSGADRLAASLPGSDHRAGAIDVADRADVRRAAEETWRLGPIDSVVYAAGLEATCDVIDMDWEAYDRVMAVNLSGGVQVAQAFGRHIVEAGRGGSFVFLSSAAGKRGEAGAGAYCASKFGLLGIVECFAAEVGRYGVRVNAICPGNVDSPMLREVAAAAARREQRGVEEVLDDYIGEAAEHRMVRPEEVASVAVWLASPEASGINGESINVDAGALTG
jgi:NAD(P)-dependent dehydrogenase (short-subunit alcohol dehydrogenase family)